MVLSSGIIAAFRRMLFFFFSVVILSVAVWVVGGELSSVSEVSSVVRDRFWGLFVILKFRF